MVQLIHHKGDKVIKATRDGEDIYLYNKNPASALWEIAQKYPEELICWLSNEFTGIPNIEKFEEIFCHERIMASYSFKTRFLGDDIGYIDQLPFINIERKVKYPTWQMSTDIGGIKAKTLLKFWPLLKNSKDLGYLLNSVGKIGQQNGLFCYSEPALVTKKPLDNIISLATTSDTFSFVSQHYKKIWTIVLFFCFVKYKKRFPVIAFISSVFNRSYFQAEVDLTDINFKNSRAVQRNSNSVDVVIPTLGRPDYLKEVIIDLSKQSYLPDRIIIVEQNPDPDALTELEECVNADWPFKIIHCFTHRTGACNARNIALEKVNSDLVFFADDDIRIPSDMLKTAIGEVHRLDAGCINFNCRQPGEGTLFMKIKQWGSFGSGTSIVNRKFLKDNKFSVAFEHGYGEDADFGMKLRLSGCDIIYHPDIILQHLKAPIGGFRKKPVMDWEKEIPKPKPSPTIMIFVKKYFTIHQIRGYRISLLLKSYKGQSIHNPLTYFKAMKKRWKRSEEWSLKLLKGIPE